MVNCLMLLGGNNLAITDMSALAAAAQGKKQEQNIRPRHNS